MEKIRWGIIGCGNVTEVKSGPGFQLAENSELVAVMRRDSAKAADYARRHQVPKWYSDANQLIADPEIDAVYIATPPDSHLHYTLLCAQAEKPVYVEKPMARSHTECLTMIRVCEDAAVPLFVAYYRRALPRFLKVRELVATKAIGEIRFVSVHFYQPPAANELTRGNLPWRVVPAIAGAGNFMDLACHTLDILDYILGAIVEVKGITTNQAGLYPAEDMVTCNFRVETNVLGSGVWCFSAFTQADLNEIVGTNGKICFSTFGSEPIQLITSAGSQQFAIENPSPIQLPLIQTIVNELLGIGQCPSIGVTAARTNKVMDEVLKDWRQSHGIDFS